MQSQRERRARDDPGRRIGCGLEREPEWRDLFKTGIAGTQQLVEQADANATKAIAQRRLNVAQLDQQKAAPAAIEMI